MKTEINRDGQLTISAETGLEAYALMKWSDDQIKDGVQLPGLLIKTGVEDAQEIDFNSELVQQSLSRGIMK